MIIEDDPDVRDMLITMLTLRGWNPSAAPDGRVGLAMLRDRLPDVVLCDVMMPEVDGFAVYDAVRSNDQTRSIPFVFVSAIMDPRITGRTKTPNCSFIRKPFSLAQLEKAIETAKAAA